MQLKIALTVVFAALAAPSGAQQTRRISSEELRATCIDNSSERLEALVARDWGQLIRLAKRDIALCRPIYSPEEISRIQAFITLAHSRSGNTREALQTADLCIRTFYPNTSCHLERSRSLLAIGKLQEGKRSIEVTRRLIEHAREDAKQRIDALANPSSRDLWVARLDQLGAEAEALEEIGR